MSIEFKCNCLTAQPLAHGKYTTLSAELLQNRRSRLVWDPEILVSVPSKLRHERPERIVVMGQLALEIVWHILLFSESEFEDLLFHMPGCYVDHALLRWFSGNRN